MTSVALAWMKISVMECENGEGLILISMILAPSFWASSGIYTQGINLALGLLMSNRSDFLNL
jgi:hypothetical protein